MTDTSTYPVREQLITKLLHLVEADTYPSSTQLDMIESLLCPDDVPTYTEILMKKIRNEQFPSIPLLTRIRRLTAYDAPSSHQGSSRTAYS